MLVSRLKQKRGRRRNILLRRWRFIVALLALTGILALIIANMIHPEQDSKQPNAVTKSSVHELSFGIAFSNTLSPLNQQQRVTLLKKIKAAGFNEVRYALVWDEIEPKQGQYTWTKADSIVKVVHDSGLKSVITLDGTPSWAALPQCNDSDTCAPQDVTTFSQFAGKVVSRYQKDSISAWEIWNEPNIVNFWKPAPNPSQYTSLLVSAYKAIKVQDPNATVITAGLAGNSVDSNGAGYIDPRTYLASMYSSGAQGYFDGVAFHPYTGLQLPSVTSSYNGWLKMDTGNNNIRSLMTTNGDGAKSIWITEYGVTTDGPGRAVTDPSIATSSKAFDHVTMGAADQIARAVVKSAEDKPWVKSLDWFTYKDGGTNPVDSGMFYGVFQANGSPKPIYDTLLQAIKNQESN